MRGENKIKIISDIHGGEAVKILSRRGLSGKKIRISCDFSVNLNPLGYPAEIEELFLNPGRFISDYPHPDAAPAENELAKALGLKTSNLIIGNGATEIFDLILQSVKPEKAMYCAPAYSGYAEICIKRSIETVPVKMKTSDGIFTPDFSTLRTTGAGLIFICSPNNPTGQTVNRRHILELAAAKKDTVIVVDESFMDFSFKASSSTLMTSKLPPNLILVKSLTKIYSVAGLRLGFAYGNARIISRMKFLRLPWSVNAFAQAAVPLLFQDRDFLKKTVLYTKKLHEYMLDGILPLGRLLPCPSGTNFILCKVSGMNAENLQAELMKKEILIRSCSEIYGLDNSYIRLALRPENEIDFLARELNSVFGKKKKAPSPEKIKGALMVVGTTSNAGKSITAAALCRYFANKGINVAPFKAQNMSLNSFVTPEGGEIGRAQAVQAEACRIEPHTDMNPVLLKPQGDSSSQIIINGKAAFTMNARTYYRNKQKIREKAFAAFDRLGKKYELIVMEGAGSPAEINLLKEDFVNMRMAEYAEASAILVADIDRGGVFASIFGTVTLIPPPLRKLLKGIIINKFRGDKRLLDSGIEKIEAITGIPVLGVMPFIKNLDIEDEDSLGLEKYTEASGKKSLLDIAVIKLPRISNFTDFQSLEKDPRISLRYTDVPEKLGNPDLLIIPGSKNTIADMEFLRKSGMEKELRRLHEKGTPLFGICGGYQMLGEKISDPCGVEGRRRSMRGLALLPVETVLMQEKELAQVSGLTGKGLPFAAPGTAFTGYEIHAGKSSRIKTKVSGPLQITRRGKVKCSEEAGDVSADGLVFGSYVHGLFDAAPLRLQLIEWLCRKKGLHRPCLLKQELKSRERTFNELADVLSENVDMRKISSFISK